MVGQSAPARGLVAAEDDGETQGLRRGTPLVHQRRGYQTCRRPPGSECVGDRQRDVGFSAPHRIGEERPTVASYRGEDSAEALDLRRTQPGRRWILRGLESERLCYP